MHYLGINKILFSVVVGVVYMHMSTGVQVPSEARGDRAPGARVIGTCEQPDRAAGNRTQVLYNRRKHS